MPLPGFYDQNRVPDFEVVVSFLSPKESGRNTPPHQGYRPEMVFGDDPHVWMISPEFLQEDGSSYPRGAPIPQSVRANMYVISPQVRSLLRPILSVGQKVRMVEGAHPVATGKVTAIKNLPNPLDEHETAATEFVLSALAYTRWYDETTADGVGIADMAALHEILGRLQAAAAVLSATGPTGEDSPEDDHELPAEFPRKIASKLPVNAYSHVFDPLKDQQGDALSARLDDDLEDIYRDLKHGLVFYDSGKYQDALWYWHDFYYVHWGRHLSHAQTAIWQYLSEGNWR